MARRKQEWKIDRYDLGINEGKSERDLKDNELAVVIDADVDSPGLIKNQPGNVVHEAGLSPKVNSTSGENLRQGEGLFRFSSDYQFHNYDGSVTLSASSDTPAFMKISNIDPTMYTYMKVGDTVTLANFTGGHNGTKTITSKLGSNTIKLDTLFSQDNSSDTNGTLTLDDRLIATREPSQYLGVFYQSGKKLDLYNQTTDTWLGSYVNLIPETSGDFNTIPHVYIFDGSIRVGDRSDTATNFIPNWIGWVNRNFWSGTDNAQINEQWQVTHQKLLPPTQLKINSSYQTASRYHITGNVDNNIPTDLAGGDYALDDGGIAVQLIAYKDTDASSATTTGWEAKWYIAVSFVYEGDQETPLCFRTHDDEEVDFISSREVYWQTTGQGAEIPRIKEVSVGLLIKSTSTNPIDPRIKGVNVYAREDNADTWWQIAQFDTTLGGKKASGDGTYQSWLIYPDSSSHGGRVFAHNAWKEIFPNIKTFEMSSGYSHTVTDINASYRTACVLGRNVYIGDVKMYNPDKGTVIDQGDVMVRTPINKPDTFLWSNIDIATTADGERIIHLEPYNDRILQFKENTLYVINVATDMTYIESTHQNKGVKRFAAVTKSPFGISWVNTEGVFHYDGSQVIDLLEREGSRVIKDETWNEFMNHTDASSGTADPVIGYIPKKKWLVIKNNPVRATDSVDGSAYIFSFKTGAWVYSQKSENSMLNMAGTGRMTNMINDYKDNIVYAVQQTNGSGNSPKLYQIGNSYFSGSESLNGHKFFKIITKDITFGSYSARKRIYNIYVTHRNANASRLKLYYKRTDYTSGKDSSWTELGTFDAASEWKVQKFELRQSNTVSLQLKIQNDDTAGQPGNRFEISDISIVFKENSLK